MRYEWRYYTSVYLEKARIHDEKKEIKDFDLLGARLVDPETGIDRVADLFIRQGIIYHESPLDKKPLKVFNLSGQVILPGLLDLRTHNRVPGFGKSENIESLTKAAAKGGFSSILAMPNTNPYSDNPSHDPLYTGQG